MEGRFYFSEYDWLIRDFLTHKGIDYVFHEDREDANNVYEFSVQLMEGEQIQMFIQTSVIGYIHFSAGLPDIKGIQEQKLPDVMNEVTKRCSFVRMIRSENNQIWVKYDLVLPLLCHTPEEREHMLCSSLEMFCAQLRCVIDFFY